jgi:hypothetical protein
LKFLPGDLFTRIATPIMGPFGFQAEQTLGSSSINQQTRNKGDLLMSNLIVVAYDDQFRAEEVRTKLRKLQQEYLIDLEDAVVAVRNDAGKVKLHQLYNLTASGALSGGFWGTLIGLIFMNPLLGLAVGGGGRGPSAVRWPTSASTTTS